MNDIGLNNESANPDNAVSKVIFISYNTCDKVVISCLSTWCVMVSARIFYIYSDIMTPDGALISYCLMLAMITWCVDMIST